MSLLGFLFGPALSAVASSAAAWTGDAAVSPAQSAQSVLMLSALLGGVIMLGLAATAPASRGVQGLLQTPPQNPAISHPAALRWLSGTVMFVLAGFELGIVLLGQQAGQSSRQAAIMLAECSLVMLGVNALLFVSSLLERIRAWILIGTGLLLAVLGLTLLAVDRSDA